MKIYYKLVSWALIYIVLPWLILRHTVKLLTGISIQYIDPVRLRIVGIKVRNKFKINYIQVKLVEKRLICDGFCILPQIADHDTGEKSDIEKHYDFEVPSWVWNNFGILKWLLNGLKINFSNAQHVQSQLFFNMLVLNIQYVKSKNSFVINIFTSKVKWRDAVLYEDALLVIKAKVDYDSNKNERASFHSIGLDLKIGDFCVPEMVFERKEKFEPRPVSSNTKSEIESGAGETKSDMECGLEKIQCLSDKVRAIIGGVDQVTLSIDKILFKNVPLTTQEDLLDLNRFLSYDISAANITLNLFRYEAYMPCFKMDFGEDDLPIKFNANLSGFGLSLNITDNITHDRVVLKVLDVPNISLFGVTNLLSQQFDFCNINDPGNAVCNLKGHVSSPNLDIDVEHLSLLKCFKKNINVFTGALKNAEIQPSVSMPKHCECILKYMRALVPLVSLKFTIEDPKIIVSDKHEFIVHKFSALMIDYKTRRCRYENHKDNSIFYELDCNFEVLGLRSQHINRIADYDRTIISLESIGVQNNVKILPELLFWSQVDVDAFELNLSDLPTMILINKIYRKIDSRILDVEETYFMEYYKKFADKLRDTEQKCVKFGEKMDTKMHMPNNFLFEELPPAFDYIKINIRDVMITLGARSLFMPPSVFSELESQSSDDFVNGQIRKYNHKTDKIQMAIFGNKTQWHNRIETGRTAMTRSAYSSCHKYQDADIDDISTSDATEVERIWNCNILIDNMSSSLISETVDNKTEMSTRKVSRLSVLSIKIFPETNSLIDEDSKQIILQIDNERLKSVLSLNNIFIVISGIHTLKQVFSLDICSHNKKSLAKKHFLAVSQKNQKGFLQRVQWREIKDLLQINLSSEVLTQILVLPNGLPTRFDIISSFISIRHLSEIFITGQNFRVCVESPMRKNYWVRLINVLKYSVNSNMTEIKEQMRSHFEAFESLEPSVLLENESWHFNIPHNFELYKIFDNIPTVFKAIKQMLHSFKDSQKTMVINPSPVKTPSFPKIRLKSKRFIFSIDDDPFESELNMIFQIGLQEQRSRSLKLEEMNHLVASELLKNNVEKLSKSESVETIRKCDFLGCVNTVKGKFKFPRRRTRPESDKISSDAGDSNFKKEEEKRNLEEFVTADTKAAYNRLLENFSTSWINRVKQYKAKEKKVFEKNFSFIWGNIDYTKLPLDINQRVLPFNTNPFLTNLIIEGIDINIFHPSFGVEKVPQFINSIGKGVPENMEYSIMIPLYVDAKFKEIRWHLRDYPLPLLYIPSLHSTQGVKEPDIHLYGDLIISEDMIQSGKEIRKIYVPFVPAAVEGENSRYYSLQIPRTIASLKFYTNLQLNINSKQTTQVTWGGGYQPSIQQTMQCLDNFSKPPIDPSPKIGFWDKMRYLFHARLRVSWKNNGRFEIALKGGKSPYKIGTDSAGFIVGFSGDIVLDCNENDDAHNFTSCSAEKVHFSIPNHFAKPLLVWSQPSDQRVFIPGLDDTSLEEYTSFYYLIDSDNSSPKQKANISRMELCYIEKTGIKLSGGVTLRVGIVFERLISGKRDRTLTSIPHYDVHLSTPSHIENTENYDSYAGFRSDFIHLAFTILSSSESAYNAMQLSPTGLRSFKSWWKSFAGAFPVRRGNLFGEQSISPKFGEHLFTISYFADVSPLFITYITHALNSHALKKNLLESAGFTGLKAKASQFIMDLHQRKEVLLEYQEELDKTKRVMRLKFLEAEVSVYGIDLRTVDSTLDRIKYVEEKSEGKFDIFDNDMSWYDITDFKEANLIDVESYRPTLSIRPLLYTPQFVYINHASYGDKFQVDPRDHKRIKPFDNKLSHKCRIGEPLSLPLDELNKRLEILNDFKVKTENDVRNSKDPTKKRKLEGTMSTTLSAIKNIEILLEDMKTVEKKRSDGANDESFSYPIIDVMFGSSRQNVKFENRYYICNMLLKWNEDTRDVVYRFLHNFNLSNDLNGLSAQKCMHFFENIVNQRMTGNSAQKKIKNGPHMQDILDVMLNEASDEQVNNVLLEIFEKNIADLGFELDHSVQLKHIVHFITPQIQLITNQDPDSCIIVTAPSIKLKTLSFCSENQESEDDMDTFLRRTGIHLTNANLFRFHKDDYKDYIEVFFDVNSYGQNAEHQWPPWLGMELCFQPDNLSSEALIKDFSSVLFYERVSQFSRIFNLVEDKLQNSITGYLPKIIMSSDSQSYMNIFKMVTNLLIFIAPEDAELQRQIEKLTIGLDTEDVSSMEKTILELHDSLKRLQRVDSCFSFKRQILDEADASDLVNIRSETMNHLLQLYIFMKVFSTNRTWSDNADHSLMWNFYLREIILHMLDDKGEPFVDVAIAKLHFERLQTSTGFNSSNISVHMAQAFDLQKNASYQDLLGPFYGKKSKETTPVKKPLASISWSMEKPIGGIKVIKYIETDLSDLTLCLEERQVRKVLAWFLPDDISLTQYDDQDDSNEQDTVLSVSEFDPDRINAYMNLSLEDGSDVHEMIERSTNYMIIENLVLNRFRLCISFKGSGALRLINVTNFIFSFPKLMYENQTIRVIDLLMELKGILIKDMFKHTAKFLGAKVRNHPMERKSSMGSPLKQLTRYESYMESRELEK